MKYDKELEWLVPEPLNISRWEGHSTYKLIQRYACCFDGDVADFGCNNGIACGMLSNLPAVKTVTGFDISTKAIANGKDTYKNHPKAHVEKITLKYSDFRDIDCTSGEFDAGICFHTLEHIYPEDLEPVLKEIYRTLKPGGYFIFSLPLRDAFRAAEAHVSFFSIEPEDGYIALRKLMQLAGFGVIEIYEDMLLGRGQECITGVALK